MAGETRFQKIKRIVDEQKTKKVQGIARITHLKNDTERIYQEVEELMEKKITSVEEGEKVLKDLEISIQKDIEQIEAILKSEGIEL